MQTIICPTDFSINATHAAEYACALGQKFNSQIILLHAYEAPTLVSNVGFTVIDNAGAILRENAEKKLNALSRRLAKKFPGVTLRTEIVAGPGYVRTVDAAGKHEADLIVMGATGHSRLERMILGSTTSRVIGSAKCPVMSIPKEAKFKDIKRIVFATDLQEENITAAVAVAPFAQSFNAELVFVFVDGKHLVHSNEEIKRMTKKIKSKVKYPKISGYISKNTSISRGLENFLDKYPSDLLVMYTHQKHFPDSLFHQSITKLMSHAGKVPLLAVMAK
jgi:nucleotide-binding universal stress UspA family protein